MWITIALAALVTAPAQASELRLTNDRPTFGIMGAARPDNRILPGDVYCVTFDIENLKTDNEGKISYSMALELTNAQGKVEYKREPQDIDFVNSLGTGNVPAFAGVEIRQDAPPGEYTLKVSVTDRKAKQSQILTRKFEVMPAGFGVVQLHVTFQQEGLPPAPPTCAAGQTLLVNCGVVGSKLTAKKQPRVQGEMRIMDEQGNPTVPTPFAGQSLVDRERGVDFVPMQFQVALNRPGKFTIKLKVKDLEGDKTAEATLPLTVVDPK